MVVSRLAEPRQVGSAFALASGIQAAQANHQVAQSGEVLWGVSRTNRGVIFAESDVAYIVDAFDPPVASPEGLQLSRVHLGGRTTAEHDFGFFGDADGFEMVSRAANDGRLDGVGKAGLCGRDLKGIDLAGFMASMTLIQRDVRREK
jgi:hypothetical protein